MKPQQDVYVRLIGYLRSYLPQVTVGYTCMLAASVINLVIPQVVKRAIDRGLEEGNARSLFIAAGLILAIAALRGIAAFGQRYYGEWMTHKVAYDLRTDFFTTVQLLPFSFHDRAHTGDLMSRATSDIEESERFVGTGLINLIAIILISIGVVIAMFWENASIALLAFGPIVLLLILSVRFGRLVRPMFKSVQEQMGKLANKMQESMTGITVVKSFAREEHELEKFDRENKAWFDKRYAAIRVWANNWPIFTFALAVSVFLLLWFGAPQVFNNTISVGSLFAMIWYVLILNGPAQKLGFLVNLAATAGASASRVFEIIDTPSEIAEHSGSRGIDEMHGEVIFDRVGFAYQGGNLVVDNLNFKVDPGQTVALLGPTGSGKSTVINLLPRFYDPTEGCIKIDGIDVRDIKLRDLRRNIGAVLQEIFIFSTTIRNNIAYGDHNATEEEIIAAARAANAHHFIMDFYDGYDTIVGERGVSLSGGQKQRVAIARALLLNPSILLLDDSTSSVDTQTEYQIQQALDVLVENRTTFIIAHRLLTLKGADQILVLDRGRIIERGTHETLLNNDGMYREIYDLQLRSQEEMHKLDIAD